MAGSGGPETVAELFGRIAEVHPDARADRRDGLRLDWPDCWAHVRASNTEPIVRVIAEAGDRERAHELANILGRWFASPP
jgi:phosphomannomutase